MTNAQVAHGADTRRAHMPMQELAGEVRGRAAAINIADDEFREALALRVGQSMAQMKAVQLMAKMMSGKQGAVEGYKVGATPDGTVVGNARMKSEEVDISIRVTVEGEGEPTMRQGEAPADFKHVAMLRGMSTKSRHAVKELLHDIIPDEFHGMTQVSIASGMKEGAWEGEMDHSTGDMASDVSAGTARVDAGDVRIRVTVVVRRSVDAGGLGRAGS